MSDESQVRAREFLKNADYFRLGSLPTESSHPKTKNLSDLALNATKEGVQLLQSIDVSALQVLEKNFSALAALKDEIEITRRQGGKVFICGCGATGRLALSLEHFWRKRNLNSDFVRSFMAGGDVALVHSLEGFEDFPEYGAQHLRELGFTKNDLLISSSEGGETPYVIGATMEAAKISRRAPFFLYCNPRDVLEKNVARSRELFNNKKIHNICLNTGPMALSGSTRMQASSVLMLAIGIALFKKEAQSFSRFIDFYQKTDLSGLEDLVASEAQTYKENNRVLYAADDLAITVCTDTTERSPTFSLPTFANQTLVGEDLSLVYLMIPTATDEKEGWKKLLAREPHALNWKHRNIKTTMNYLHGFDFSRNALALRKRNQKNSEHHVFTVEHDESHLKLNFRGRTLSLAVGDLDELYLHTFLKMVLNIHSTLLMGRLGRYQSNVMTYVSPTNGKLIDRATRYVQWLLDLNQISCSYEEVVIELFNQIDFLQPSESVVLKTQAVLSSKYSKGRV